MENHGTMQEIRGKIKHGYSSTQVISSGYVPGCVYEAQKQGRCAWTRYL